MAVVAAVSTVMAAAAAATKQMHNCAPQHRHGKEQNIHVLTKRAPRFVKFSGATRLVESSDSQPAESHLVLSILAHAKKIKPQNSKQGATTPSRHPLSLSNEQRAVISLC